MQTLGSVPLVSILKRLDCNADTSVMQTLGSVPLVSILRRLDCNADTSVVQTLGSVPLVSILRQLDCNADTSVMQILGSVPLVFMLRRLHCNTDPTVMRHHKWQELQMLTCYYSFFSFNKMVHESRPFGLFTMSLSVMHESAHDTKFFQSLGKNVVTIRRTI